jgi:hypothetical protein
MTTEKNTELQSIPNLTRVQGRKDRRATPRFAVELECEERSHAGRYFRITQDLSTFGLSTRQGFAYEPGAKVHLTLRLPDDPTPVQLEAEVVGSYDHRGGLRMAFRNPSVDSIRRVHRFLTRYGDRNSEVVNLDG